MKHWLSKSTYLRAAQCLKALFLEKYHKELKDTVPPERQAVFRRGHEIGHFAWGLFPGGIDVRPSVYWNFEQHISRTQQAVASGRGVIYEAAFQHEGVLAILDMLVRKEDGWHAFEVKSGTRITSAYLEDASLQYHVISESGIQIRDFSLIRPNKSYVRHGALDPHGFFLVQSVLEHVKGRTGQVASFVNICRETLESRSIPELDPGKHCHHPYPCDFISHCHRRAPILETGLLDMDIKYALYNDGIDTINEIPSDHPVRKDPKYCPLFAKELKVDQRRLSHFVDPIEFPVCFIDFECTMPAIPPYEGAHPYEAIPFLFCIRRLEAITGESSEFCYFHRDPNDPRRALCHELLNQLQGIRSVLTFGGEMELSILNNLLPVMIGMPSDAANFEVYDLKKLFSRRIISTPEMNGHMNLFASAQALGFAAPTSSHIFENGYDVALAYEEMMHTDDLFKQQTLASSLERYCKQDVEMIEHIFKAAFSFLNSD